MKPVRRIAVRGSSYIPIHEGQPLRRESNLLKIHNGSDDNCFLPCYTAGYHIVYKKIKNGATSTVPQTQSECSYIQQREPVSQDADREL